jgi:hypothetical protein
MSVASNEEGEIAEKPTEKQQEALVAEKSKEDESADKADRQPPKDITDDLDSDASKDVLDKVAVEEAAVEESAVKESSTEKVKSEKPKGYNKIPIDFMCPVKSVCNGTQPKTVDKLQEHLRLSHNYKKGNILWPTAEKVKDGSYQKLLAENGMLFKREEKEKEPELPSKSAPYIRKRGGILDIVDSDGSLYEPKSSSESDSDGSPCEGLKEIGYTKRVQDAL